MNLDPHILGFGDLDPHISGFRDPDSHILGFQNPDPYILGIWDSNSYILAFKIRFLSFLAFWILILQFLACWIRILTFWPLGIRILTLFSFKDQDSHILGFRICILTISASGFIRFLAPRIRSLNSGLLEFEPQPAGLPELGWSSQPWLPGSGSVADKLWPGRNWYMS